MQARWVWGLMLPAAIAAGAAPAYAKPRSEVHERGLTLRVPIKASNGYRGQILTEGHRQVTLSLSRGETTLEAQTQGKVTRRGIDAHFGHMGKISLRFQGHPVDPRRFPGKGERRCRGRKTQLEEGLFSGTIRFRGEREFTEVDLKRAKGSVERRYRRVCRANPGRELFEKALKRLINDLPITLLRARGRDEDANILFEAATLDLRPFLGAEAEIIYGFSAQIVERSEAMRLTRSVSAIGDPGSFLYRRGKKAPRRATVTPPKPFSGTAQYVEQADISRTWIGPLAVRLPGAGLVELTGPGFKADTCERTLRSYIESPCLPGSNREERRALSSLGPKLPQLSGSQSQAFWDARLSWSR